MSIPTPLLSSRAVLPMGGHKFIAMYYTGTSLRVDTWTSEHHEIATRYVPIETLREAWEVAHAMASDFAEPVQYLYKHNKP